MRVGPWGKHGAWDRFSSKEGILRELMRAALFGPRFQAAQTLLEGISDPVERLARTAHAARAVYEGEAAELGGGRGVSAFSPALRQLEEEPRDDAS
jgi:hypothetical protein